MSENHYQPPPEMVRRVCDAIDGTFSHSDLNWEKCARAAIAAMRDITPSMQEAAFSIVVDDPFNLATVAKAWAAAIDEALK